MSWRGVKKQISRLPHQFKTKNSGEVTKDEEYLDLEQKYKSFVKNEDEFRVGVFAYRDNLANLLNNQASAANHLAELCNLKTESSNEEDYNEEEIITPELKQALEDYATAMAYCKQESYSLLDDLDATVLRPLEQFRTITKTVDKTMTKREHKLIDYDRFRHSYFKYSAIPNPSPSEEKNMTKLQTQYENAAHEYDHFNNMLKEELIMFLDLAQQLIQPLLENFYDIQSRAMGGIYSRFNEVIQHNSAYFPTLHLPIEKGFELRLSQRNVREELESFDVFHKASKPWERRAPSSFSNGTDYRTPSYQADHYRRPSHPSDGLSNTPPKGYPSMHKSISIHSSASSSVDDKPTPPPLSARPAFLNTTRARSVSSPNVPPPIHRPSFTPSPQSGLASFTPSPQSGLASFTPSPQSGLASNTPSPQSKLASITTASIPPVRNASARRNTVSMSPFADDVVKKKRAPPPPPPPKKFSSPSVPKKEYVEALYELNGPQEGDLSFQVGDLIEVLEKSEKTDDWWKGRLGNRTGMFPANYVKPCL